jgi:hypothetical protein
MKAYKTLLFGVLALCWAKSSSQDLYNKYRQVLYNKTELIKDKGRVRYDFNDYTLEFKQGVDNKQYLVLLYKSKVLQNFQAVGFDLKQMPRFAYIADLNGDGIKDLKILVPSNGASPLSREASLKLYLLSRNTRSFNKLSFFDCSSEPERDMDSDGKYEIFTRELYSYKGHSFWKHQIYSFKDHILNNVSLKYNHPIMVRLIMPHKYTPLILGKKERKKLCSKLPQQFSFQ